MTKDTETPLVYTAAQAAEACQCHVNTLRQWLREGKLPFIRLGERKLLIPRKALEAALNEGLIGTRQK